MSQAKIIFEDVKNFKRKHFGNYELIKQEARSNPLEMLHFITNGKFKKLRHTKIITNALMRVFTGEIKNLIINIPPRHSKTEMLMGFIAWSLGWFPDSLFINVSYGAKLAEMNGLNIRSLILNEKYKELFPHVKLDDSQQAKDYFKVKDEGGAVYSAGANAALTGFGAGRDRPGFGGAIIIDDPHKTSEIHSVTKRESVIRWYYETLTSRKNSQKTPTILIMQRLHMDDLTGFLVKNEFNDWEKLIIPVFNEKGEVLWDKYTVEQFKALEKVSPYTFYSQYMQEPISIHNCLFDRKIVDRYRYDIPPSFERVIITADTAQKTKDHNDYSVFQLWGLNKDGDKIYLIDMIRDRIQPSNLKRVMLDFIKKHENIRIDGIYIEDAVSGTQLIEEMQKSVNIPTHGILRRKDKVERAIDVVTFYDQGRIWFPNDKDFMTDFTNELTSFTADMSHKYDDQVDTMMDACDILLFSKIKEGEYLGHFDFSLY